MTPNQPSTLSLLRKIIVVDWLELLEPNELPSQKVLTLRGSYLEGQKRTISATNHLNPCMLKMMKALLLLLDSATLKQSPPLPPPQNSGNFPSILSQAYMVLAAEKKRGKRLQTTHPTSKKGVELNPAFRPCLVKPSFPPKLHQDTSARARN